jgi:hypothetical protein
MYCRNDGNIEQGQGQGTKRVTNYSVGAVDVLGLLAEGELFLAAEHLVDALAVEDGNFGPEALQFLQQDAAALADLLAGQVGAALGGPGHHVGEADAVVQQLEVVVGRHGLGHQTGQVQTFPCGASRQHYVIWCVESGISDSSGHG